MNRYDFYPGDWQRDTSDLDIVEDGIYRRLIDWYYSNERPIPDDRAELIVKCTNEVERKKTQWVLSRFFKKEPIGSDSAGFQWRSQRCDIEIEKAQTRINAARLNGKKGGRPRKEKPTKNPMGYPVGNPEHNPEKSSPSPSPSEKNVTGKDPRNISNRNTGRKQARVAKGTPTWEAYSWAYAKRYGREPIRNTQMNSLCARLVDALGADIAPKVATYYLTTDTPPYSTSLHPLTLLLRDYQRMHTEWETGIRASSSYQTKTQQVVQNSLLALREE